MTTRQAARDATRQQRTKGHQRTTFEKARPAIFGVIVVGVLLVGGYLAFGDFLNRPAAAAGTIDVQSSMAGFTPSEIRVKAGSTVTLDWWTQDASVHLQGGVHTMIAPELGLNEALPAESRRASHLAGPEQARHLRRLVRLVLRRQGQPHDARQDRRRAGVRVSGPAAGRLPRPTLLFGWPRPAIALAALIVTVGTTATAYVLAVPFDTAAFGGLTVPTVLASGLRRRVQPVRVRAARAVRDVHAHARQRGHRRRHPDARGAPPPARRGLALRRRRAGHLLHHRPRACSASSAGWAATTSWPAAPRSSRWSWPCGCSRTCSCRASGRR